MAAAAVDDVGQKADCGVTMAGGPQVGVACAFPFVFNGFIYREGGGGRLICEGT